MTSEELSVSQFTTFPQSFENDLDLFAETGVKAIELCERKLSTDAATRERQIDRLRESGLCVSSVQPRVHALFPDRMSPEPKAPHERMSRFRTTIDRLAGWLPDSRPPLVTIGGRAPGGDFRDAYATAVASYRQLADYAEKRGLRIAFEPLHPVLMNVDTFVCTWEKASELVDDVARENFGLVADTWNIWHEVDIERRLAAAGSRVFVAQLSDWPPGGPRRMDDRLVPGDGEIDLPRLVSAIRRSGHDRPFELEILSDEQLEDSLWKSDFTDVIRRSQAAFRKILESTASASNAPSDARN